MKIELSKTLRSVILLHALIFICGSVSGATIDEIRGLWDIGSLKKTPSFRDAALKEDGVKGIFIEGLPCKGRKTEFFAWYGIPKNASGKVPGIILLHGSGLTANVEWVRIWNDKGYAAIAIDYDGCIPVANVSGCGGWTYHKWGGPCHAAQFDQANLDLKNQWFYHAVANAIQAHSFLLSRPEVDPEQTGLTGISWGAQLALIVSGLDGRYKFTVPVYASGFLDESSHWTETIKKLGPEKAARWTYWQDPRHYIPLIKNPVLLINGTNDPFYFDSTVKSFNLLNCPKQLCLKVRLPHSHPAAYQQKEVYAFADSIVKNETKLPQILKQNFSNGDFSCEYASVLPVQQITYNYTKDSGDWKKRKWETLTVSSDGAQGNKFFKEIDGAVSAFFFNITDNGGLTASSIPVIKNQ